MSANEHAELVERRTRMLHCYTFAFNSLRRLQPTSLLIFGLRVSGLQCARMIASHLEQGSDIEQMPHIVRRPSFSSSQCG